jgi:hypothetical protein
MSRRYRYQIVSLDRVQLRKAGTKALDQLNALGAEGWHIVHVKEAPQNDRDLLFFLERVGRLKSHS